MDHFIITTKRKYNENREYGNADKIRIKIILQLVGRGKKVLDAGCYNGYLSKLLINNSNTVYGVDIANKSLARAAELGVITKMADLEKSIPYPADSFDVVVAAEVIEHLKNTDQFLDEIFRVLKPGGFTVISTSNFVSLGRRLMYLMGREGYHEASSNYPKNAAGHLRYFNKWLLFGLLTLHRFKVIHFCSDVVNLTFNTNSKLRSTLLARLFPTLGRSLIVKAKKADLN